MRALRSKLTYANVGPQGPAGPTGSSGAYATILNTTPPAFKGTNPGFTAVERPALAATGVYYLVPANASWRSAPTTPKHPPAPTNDASFTVFVPGN